MVTGPRMPFAWHYIETSKKTKSIKRGGGRGPRPKPHPQKTHEEKGSEIVELSS